MHITRDGRILHFLVTLQSLWIGRYLRRRRTSGDYYGKRSCDSTAYPLVLYEVLSATCQRIPRILTLCLGMEALKQQTEKMMEAAAQRVHERQQKRGLAISLYC